MLAFKVDENLPVEVTELLRNAGFDAMNVHEQNMVGSMDTTLAQVCREEKRVIVTLDLDFADIRHYPPEEQAGIVVLRPDRQDKEHILTIVRRLIPNLNDEALLGKLWIVNEQTIRIRG
jgi:predicted nuclease of predicted toxin-antitoxin system